MKSMIFAAGLGTRLKPITDTLPKALVPVAGKPLIEHVTRKLWSYGIREVVVNVHSFADKIEDWIDDQSWITTKRDELTDENILFEVSDERLLLLETGGAIMRARGYLEGCGKFLIHNVDILSNCDFEWLENQVKEDALATLLVSRRKTSRYFLFEPNSLRLVGWMNTQTGESVMVNSSIAPEDCIPLAFSGIHILSDRVFEAMDEYLLEMGLPVDVEKGTRFPIKDFYLWAAKKYPVYAAVAEDLELIDVGKLDTLTLAEDYVKRNLK